MSVGRRGMSANLSKVALRVIADIRLLIEQEHLSVGQRIPSERELASICSASRSTVRVALDWMRQQGELQTRPGRAGTVIAEPQSNTRVDVLTKATRIIERSGGSILGFPVSLAAQGIVCNTRILSVTMCAGPRELQAAFGVSEHDPLLRIERIRQVDGTPLSYEQTYVDPAQYPGFEELDLTGSIYQLLQLACGAHIAQVEETIEVTPGLGRCARHLQVATGTPLLRLSSRATDQRQRTVVISHDTYPANAVRLRTVKPVSQ